MRRTRALAIAILVGVLATSCSVPSPRETASPSPTTHPAATIDCGTGFSALTATNCQQVVAVGLRTLNIRMSDARSIKVLVSVSFCPPGARCPGLVFAPWYVEVWTWNSRKPAMAVVALDADGSLRGTPGLFL